MLELAADPRFVGGLVGMVGVLHTWTRDLRYHPHVHYIATGGGLSPDGSWLRSRSDFFVHVKPLSILFRVKFRDLLKQTDLLVDSSVWGKDWVVHCQGVGSGQAAFKYLAPYIFRVAIGNRRIVKLDNGLVTFSYKESATDQVRFSTIPAEEFIRRFLQHVLPDRFVKVRYYGLLSPANRRRLEKAREILGGRTFSQSSLPPEQAEGERPPRCPSCGNILVFVQRLKPQPRRPP